jgi:hypothetical protein
VLHVLRVVRQHRKALVLGIVVEHCTVRAEAQAIRETLFFTSQEIKRSKTSKAKLACTASALRKTEKEKSTSA